MVDRLHPTPLPLPTSIVERAWSELARRPELACSDAWSEACRGWWQDASDARLREFTRLSLFLDEEAAAAWRTATLDEKALIKAQRHIVAARAGVERQTASRLLATGFRTNTVIATYRDGWSTEYMAASDVAAHTARLGRQYEELPAHPFVRAAWLLQAVGAIHPFRDSNGGTARFLSSIALARAFLPPFAITAAQREGSYIAALMHANRNRLGPLVEIVYGSMQQTVADLLLGQACHPDRWTELSRRRAERWTDILSTAWRTALGASATIADVTRDAIVARVVRGGTRLPLSPEAHTVEWHSVDPLSVRLDVAITPVRGGPESWLCVGLESSVDLDQHVANQDEMSTRNFVAPSNEPDGVADERFAAWCTQRISLFVRGIAEWL